MKEAIGGTWIFGLVITFLALFTTFVSVSTNYSRVYKIKDEILLTIERNHGINQQTLATINSYLRGLGYSSTGECPDNDACWNAFSINDDDRVVGYGSNTNYCIKKHVVNKKYKEGDAIQTTGPIGNPESAYYEAVVFFRIDWPILNRFFNIKISGETSTIYLLNDNISGLKDCG